MDYTFTAPFTALKPSAIREILKNTADSDTIPLAAGNPAPDAFPVEDVRKIVAEIFEKSPVLALQYGVTDGYAPLVADIEGLARSRYGIEQPGNRALVTSGAQQVMSLMSQIFINRGDTVICEEPSFIGSLNCFRSYGARLAGVSIEADGICIDELEARLKSEKNVKFIYTIPNFQNPSGSTMSLAKRRSMYELAKKYGVLIIEDNPYGDIRVAGDDLPSIKSFDTQGIVVYSGSFSKIVAPGIRVGFVYAPEEIISKLTVAKQTQDVHTPLISQLIVHKWLTECDFEGHIEKIRGIYRKKLALMCDAIDSELLPYVSYVRPEGGLFVWCKLIDGIDMLEFCTRAAANGVAVVPGTAFLCDESAKTQYIRLNFSTPEDSRITQGIKTLAQVASSF